MSDGKEQAGSAPGTAASAEASLREAVTSAKAARPKAPGFRLKLRLPIAVALLGGLCIGSLFGGASVALLTRGAQVHRAAIGQTEWRKLATRLDAQAAESARLAADLKLLKDRSGEAHEAAERARTESGARFGQLAERIDRVAKLGGDAGTKLAALTEKLDHLDREQSARLAALGETIGRQHAAAAPAAPAAPTAAVAKTASAEPALTGSLPDKPAAKPAPAVVDSWVLRDVYDGVAMIENRNRRLVEVGPGDTVPGIGRVETIERRGKTWVVVTKSGLITSQMW
ncbi:hypothetical protein [Methylobacterium sp. ID0610]|uniref:hypothetical protein n=1 Tax=Methylobacterium carpenticola TaxID=3344827 RepID=UPI003689B3C0